TVDWLCHAVRIDRRRTWARPGSGIVAKHGVVARIGGAINPGGLLRPRALLGRKAGLFLSSGRPGKNQCGEENQYQREPFPERILMHGVFTLKSLVDLTGA